MLKNKWLKPCIFKDIGLMQEGCDFLDMNDWRTLHKHIQLTLKQEQ